MVIERYPDRAPYPSRLVLHHIESRPLHAVAAENTVEHETIIVTAYEPTTDRWEPDFTRRKPK